MQPATTNTLEGFTERKGSVPAALVEALDIAVFEDLAEIEPVWRRFEASAVRSIYQRFDWLAPWARLAGPHVGVRPSVVVGSLSGETMFLLPLGRWRCGPARVVGWLGGTHVNISSGLFHADFLRSLDPSAVRILVRRIVAALGRVDYLDLANQPRQWQGYDNPFWHLPRRIGAQPVQFTRLDPDFDVVLGRSNGAKKRKRVRWQENTFARAGGYRFYRAGTPEEAFEILDAFLAQKAVQFSRNGVDNVFAVRGTADFLREIAQRSAALGDPLIEFYGLKVGGKLRATFAAGVDRGRVHGYFGSLAQDEFTRFSPGALLLHNLVRESCARGFSQLDLGVGEEPYKSSWLDDAEPHFTTYVPVTMLGRVLVSGLLVANAAKLKIRQNRRLWSLVKRLRQTLAAARGYGLEEPGSR